MKVFLLVLSVAALVSAQQTKAFSNTFQGSVNGTNVGWFPYTITDPVEQGVDINFKTGENSSYVFCANPQFQPGVVNDLRDFCAPEYLLNFTGISGMGNLDLSPDTYYFGIQNIDTLSNDTFMYNTKISGVYCLNGVGFNGQCVQPDEINISKNTTVVSLQPGASVYQFNVPKNTAFIGFTIETNYTKPNSFGEDVTNQTTVVWLRQGAVPTTDNYAAADLSGDVELDVEVDSPAQGTWYMLFLNQKRVANDVQINMKSVVCSNDTQFGENCDIVPTPLTFSGTKKEQPADSGLTYFALYGSNEGIRVSVANSLDDDDDSGPTIYLRAGNLPTTNSYSSKAEGKVINFIDVFSDDEMLGGPMVDYFVGVDADDEFIIWQHDACANNCTDNGVCDSDTGMCDCDSKKGGLDCTGSHKSKKDKKLPLKWIILICVAGAIILAVAIGVPVACYLRHRKRTRYERV